MAIGFHALGGDFQLKPVGHGQDALGDGAGRRIVFLRAHERLVDLDPVERKTPQITQAGVTGTKVVQRELQPPIMQSVQRTQSLGFIPDQHTFGDLQFQAPGWETFVGQHIDYHIRQVV